MARLRAVLYQGGRIFPAENMDEMAFQVSDFGSILRGSAPLYQQIAQRMSITIGQQPGSVGRKLPTEEQLACHFGVSMITIRAALKELATQGVIERQQGRGTYVRKPDTPPAVWALGTVDDLIMTSRMSDTSVIGSGYVKPPHWASALLGGASPDRVFNVKITRSKAGTPFVLTDAYYPPEIGPRIVAAASGNDLRRSRLLIETVEERVGERVDEIRQTMLAIEASAKVARILQVRVGSPVLLVTRVSGTSGGHVLQVGRSYYRSKGFAYSVHLRR